MLRDESSLSLLEDAIDDATTTHTVDSNREALRRRMLTPVNAAQFNPYRAEIDADSDTLPSASLDDDEEGSEEQNRLEAIVGRLEEVRQDEYPDMNRRGQLPVPITSTAGSHSCPASSEESSPARRRPIAQIALPQSGSTHRLRSGSGSSLSSSASASMLSAMGVENGVSKAKESSLSPPLVVKRSAPVSYAFRADTSAELASRRRAADASLASERPADYLFAAGEQVSLASRREAEGDYELCFGLYKLGIDILLRGVQSDDNEMRRDLVRRKIKKWVRRAEQIYASHLAVRSTCSSPSDVGDASSASIRRAGQIVDLSWVRVVRYICVGFTYNSVPTTCVEIKYFFLLYTV